MNPHPSPSTSILIVDDSHDLVETMTLSLNRSRYTVEIAENGRSALRKIREGFRPSLILLDLLMPVMSGWEFLEIRRQDPELSRTPVIVLSASMYQATPLTKDLPYLEKPFTVDALDAKITEVLSASKLI